MIALVMTVLGAVLIVAGVAFLSVPAAMIVAGVEIVAFGLLGVDVDDGGNE